MDFEWDDEKAESNWQKHRIEFEFAAQVFFDPHRIEKYDVSHSRGEERWQTIGMVPPSTVLMVVYTERGPAGESIRLISARKANSHEQNAYDKVLSRSK